MAKRGRPKSIATSERFYELFTLYKTVVKSDPKLVQDFVGKDGDEVYRKREKPLTMEGFENYVADEGIRTDLADYFSNKGGAYGDFSTVCSRIKREIRQDQIEGGMAGIYNPSITQRLNGLADKKEHVVDLGVKPSWLTDNLPADEK